MSATSCPPLPAGVFDVLDAAVRSRPDGEALVTRSGTYTYRELDALADTAAGALFELGVRAGDRVGASLPNDTDVVVAFHGAMRIGAVWVGINRALAAPEKTYMLEDSGVDVFLVDEEVAAGLTGRAGPWRLVEPGQWTAAMASSDGRPDLPTPDPTVVAGISYTSGTTGFPKGAVHCQAGLILPGAATVARRGWGPGLRKGDSLPLTILNMQTLTTVLTAQAGGTSIVMDRSDVASIIEWISREKVAVWNGPPPQLHTMVTDPTIDPADLASLDEVWAGGADCPDRLRDAFEAKFDVKVMRTYGLTEAPALVCLDDLEGPRAEGTSGRPLDHAHLMVRDGEFCLSAHTEGPWAGIYRPLLGYWNKPDASAEVLAGGYLHTGDLGTIDESGHIRVAGRKSQVINRGGANVYPAEVERILMEAPGVASCAVVGVPDERLGERVGAAVEPPLGGSRDAAAILAHCRASLASYKVPERMIFVDSLPRNQMGKVPRNDVIKLIIAAGADARV